MPETNHDTRHMLFASAMREARLAGYGAAQFRGDVVAGLTIGVIALPLAMALAIATGVPPQYGLYAAIVGGLIIPLTGGSRFNVSGPTAAFVAILLPIVTHYGIGGLLVATVMAGIVLLGLGLTRMGRVVQYIPYPVVVGFTAGIGLVIAILQVKDFLGLTVAGQQEHFVEKVAALVRALPTARGEEALIGGATLALMLLWPKLKSRVPAHLVALVGGTLLAIVLAALVPGFEVATIGSRFHWSMGGESGNGIPPFPPMFTLPWNLPGPDGQPVGLTLEMVRELLPAAFAIALLGAIESLLCAVVADGFAGTRHNPNAELVGQGLGNIAAPFFGGITCTAALARTSANVRLGASSPMASAIHALSILAAVVLMAPLLSLVPMAALAALLVVVAWNLAEFPHFFHTARVAPRADTMVLLTCFGLTVVFDMVLAVGVGIVLAAILFIMRMAELTGVETVEPGKSARLKSAPAGVVLYDINGPLFFGAARQALENLRFSQTGLRVVVLDMTDVPAIDMTGLTALEALLQRMRKRKLVVVICQPPERIRAKLERAGVVAEPGVLYFAPSLDDALELGARLAA